MPSAPVEADLPQTAIPIALLFFNVGVEVGQLAFIATVFALWSPIHRHRLAWPSRLAGITAYAIGTVAVYWTIERMGRF